jgi:hypothetical protein
MSDSDQQPKQTLEGISKEYLDSLSSNTRDGVSELEVRFGTGKGMKHVSRIQYDSVVKRLLSNGFRRSDNQYLMRIQSEYIDNRGVTRLSRVRAEMAGLGNVSEYCRTNDIKPLFDRGEVQFVEKNSMKDSQGKFLEDYIETDFNFKVSLSMESNKRTGGLVQGIVNSWKDNKKTFRYMSRHRFTHPDLPINADLSVVKTSAREGRFPKPTYTFDEARVVESPEIYEVEIEIDNSRVGLGTKYSSPSDIVAVIKKAVRIVLSGLQGTNYPTSFSSQQAVIDEYMAILWGDKATPGKRVYNKNFVGPSSYTLQVKNIATVNEDANIPNIRNDYTVTDKADGERKLMMITKDGSIYLIDTNMQIQFTGARTRNENIRSSIIDGEHILHDKSKRFINLYAAFDIYYLEGKDIRELPFSPIPGEDPMKTRLPLLTMVMNDLAAVGVFGKDASSPMRFEYKTFYVASETQSIFNVCGNLLSKVEDGVLEYETDGLIFTPARLGVGTSKLNSKPGLPIKKTWLHSFKWKPVEQNTIDFLVTLQKGSDGRDTVKTVFQKGTDLSAARQITQYKTAVLRVGFNEAEHGYINPNQAVYDDELPEPSEEEESDKYQPMQFFPTNPVDNEAGICNLLLEDAPGGEKVLFTKEREAIEDNMIVEFSYDIDKERAWRWQPLRIRYDKTADLRAGGSNYGNAYHVANSNWHTIHNPITKEMITTSQGIPDEIVDDEVYYNRDGKTTVTKHLRDFHNLFIKKKLIRAASSPGNTLIDLAVGMGGDISKWINAKLRFVFGVDISKDNIDNRLKGAYARYLNYRKEFKRMPDALFVNGNASVNVRDLSAIVSDKGKQITNAVFGKGSKNVAELGKGVYRNYGIGKDGFDVCSVQFAIHYMFHTPQTLNQFLRNVSETTKVGGYFIGTSYDGRKVFDMLKGKKQGESIQIKRNNERIWEITKRYDSNRFEADSSSLGYAIDVYQESINKVFTEYLVNYDYLDRMIENYGFTRLTREEARTLGLPSPSGSFKEMFGEMMNEIKRNPRAANEYGKAGELTVEEQTVSFLNRYFIYRKTHDVDAKEVAASLTGSTQAEVRTEKEEAEVAKEAAEKVVKATKTARKSRKLKKRLVLKE